MKNKGILIAKSPELENCGLSYSDILTEDEREVFLEDYKSLQESCHDMKPGQLVMCALARTNKYAHTYAMENGLDCYYDESKILPLLMEIL